MQGQSWTGPLYMPHLAQVLDWAPCVLALLMGLVQLLLCAACGSNQDMGPVHKGLDNMALQAR